MPAFKQTPASIRYFKARLSIFKRPTFWAAASGLILSTFLVGEYLSNPQSYTGGEDPQAATLPPNQNPLGALPPQNTIASNSEIFETLPELSNVPTQNSSDPKAASDSARSPLLQEFLLGRSSSPTEKAKPGRSQARSQGSPFASPASSGGALSEIPARGRTSASKLPSLYPAASSAVSFPTAFPNPSTSSNPDSRTPALNPLQSALDRYSSTTTTPLSRPSDSSSALPIPRSLAQPSPENQFRDSGGTPANSPAQNNFGAQSTSPQGFSPSGLPASQFAAPPFTPQLSPSPGTTGYTLPPTLRTATPSISSPATNFQPIPGQITPPVVPAVPRQSSSYSQPASPQSSGAAQPAYPSSQPSPAQFAQPSSPFSVPRQVPGRSTGNGQINTFSNP